jgi:hypothetical protein
MDARQLGVHERIVGVIVEGRFPALAGFVHFPQFNERAGDALAEVVFYGFGGSELFKKWTRVG